jgi:hypothetical protein
MENNYNRNLLIFEHIPNHTIEGNLMMCKGEWVSQTGIKICLIGMMS